MLRLNSARPTLNLELVLGGAPLTVQPSFVACWDDVSVNGHSGGANPGVATGTTPVVMVAAPGSGYLRDIDYISVVNRDTFASTVTIQYREGSNVYPILTVTLAIGSQLCYTHGSGWNVVDKDGNVKSGNTGPAGATGGSGPQGVATYLEAEGPEGEMGMIGPRGPQGIQGIQGITGNAGPAGPAIFLVAEEADEPMSAAPGRQGIQGIQGLQGQTGQAIYLVGDDGEQGDMGPVGNRGPVGLTGPQGPMGVTLIIEPEEGELGPPGAPGVTGSQGLTGAPGPAGSTIFLEGDQGEDGPPVPGPAGMRGVDGVQGKPGVAVLLDGEAGEDGLPGPQGAQGLQGLTGAVGPAGPATHFLLEIPDFVEAMLGGGSGNSSGASFNPLTDPWSADLFYNRGLMYGAADNKIHQCVGPNVLIGTNNYLQFYDASSGWGYGDSNAVPFGVELEHPIIKFKARIRDVDPKFQYDWADIDIARWLAIGNSSSAVTLDRMNAFTDVGTATARNVANTNLLTKRRRKGFVSAAGAGSLCGMYYTTAQWAAWDSGTGAGGFYCDIIFGVSDAASVTGARQFIGMSSSVAAPTNVDPATLTNSVGLIKIASDDTQFYFYCAGSSAQTPVACGTNFPCNSLSADLYTLRIAVGTDNSVTMRLDRGSPMAPAYATSASFSGTGGVTCPSGSTFLAPRAWRCNNATALAVGLDISQWQIANTIFLS